METVSRAAVARKKKKMTAASVSNQPSTTIRISRVKIQIQKIMKLNNIFKKCLKANPKIKIKI